MELWRKTPKASAFVENVHVEEGGVRCRDRWPRTEQGGAGRRKVTPRGQLFVAWRTAHINTRDCSPRRIEEA